MTRAGTTEVRIRLKARGANLSRFGRVAAYAAVPWALGWMILTDIVLRANGVRGEDMPPIIRLMIVAIGLAPIVILVVGVARPVGPLRRLTRGRRAEAMLSTTSLSLRDATTEQIWPWTEVRGLEKAGSGWQLVVGPDGSRVDFPSDLVYPSDDSARSFAEFVVALLPDVFVLIGPSEGAGGPAGFARHGDPREITRSTALPREKLVVYGLVVLFSIVAVVLMVTRS